LTISTSRSSKQPGKKNSAKSKPGKKNRRWERRKRVSDRRTMGGDRTPPGLMSSVVLNRLPNNLVRRRKGEKKTGADGGKTGQSSYARQHRKKLGTYKYGLNIRGGRGDERTPGKVPQTLKPQRGEKERNTVRV